MAGSDVTPVIISDEVALDADGISVATSFKPDILLIDEVLGVGDAAFKEKSKAKVRELIDASGSVVIVSHSYSMLSQICDRILVLEQGETIVLDEADISIKIYQRLIKS